MAAQHTDWTREGQSLACNFGVRRHVCALIRRDMSRRRKRRRAAALQSRILVAANQTIRNAKTGQCSAFALPLLPKQFAPDTEFVK